MKSATRYIFIVSGGLALLITFGLSLTAQAQNREKYLISAKAGGINFVSGNVTVRRKGEKSERALTSSDDLWTGDSVMTGAGGRVEVLLNPGSYMRVAENSEFELTDATLDNLLVTLARGSAVVEVTGGEGVELMLGINTPQAHSVITRGGIYRFNALPDGTTEVIVKKGRVIVDKATPSEVKSGRKVIIGRAATEIAKADNKSNDTLDLWSKDRAKTLAYANRRLERTSLLSSYNDYTWGDMSRWGQMSPRLGSLGLWVFNPSYNSFCFLPIGPTAWSSPYGHRYGNGFNPYGIPDPWQPQGAGNWPRTIVGNPRVPGSNGGVGNGTGNGNGVGNGSVSPSPAPQPQPMPQPAPVRDVPVERPTREYTIQSPNR
jgi:hypothetical protein